MIFPAHYHPGRENVTVISGTFYAGMGKKYDARKLTAFPPGSFISIPGGQPHYAMTKGPAVIQSAATNRLATSWSNRSGCSCSHRSRPF